MRCRSTAKQISRVARCRPVGKGNGESNRPIVLATDPVPYSNFVIKRTSQKGQRFSYFNKKRVVIAALVLSQYTCIIDDDRRQTTCHQPCCPRGLALASRNLQDTIWGFWLWPWPWSLPWTFKRARRRCDDVHYN